MDVIRIVQNIVLVAGQVAQLTYYLEQIVGSSINTADKIRIAADYVGQAWAGSTLDDDIDNTADLNLLTIYDFNPATGLSVNLGQTSLALVTTGTADALPAQCAAKVDVFSIGRNRPGSWYIPGLTVGGILSDGSATVGVVGRLTQFGTLASNDFVDGATSTEWRPSKYSAKDNAMFYLDGSIVVNDVIDTQRRRKPGVGS